MESSELLAQELSGLRDKARSLERRTAEIERVNAQLEDAAQIMARALDEVSRHWEAVYEAMRREEAVDRETSSERDHAASNARREGSTAPPAGPEH
jgi:hypothetical protein